MQRNFSSLNEEKDENLKELVLQNELKVGVLDGLSCAVYNPGAGVISLYYSLATAAPLLG